MSQTVTKPRFILVKKMRRTSLPRGSMILVENIPPGLDSRDLLVSGFQYYYRNYTSAAAAATTTSTTTAVLHYYYYYYYHYYHYYYHYYHHHPTTTTTTTHALLCNAVFRVILLSSSSSTELCKEVARLIQVDTVLLCSDFIYIYILVGCFSKALTRLSLGISVVTCRP